METLTEKSRATIEFALRWQSIKAAHTDCLWADRVSLWRDCFPGSLCSQLLGLGEGEQATHVITPESFSQPFMSGKIVRVRPSQFVGIGNGGKPMIPRQGRFYPQGLLRGVSGVFPVSSAPCRFLGNDNGLLVFDLNHPLSNSTLDLTAHVRKIEHQLVERGGRCEDWLEAVTNNGPGMQARHGGNPTDFFSPAGFRRSNEEADHLFYQQPRLVQHLDSTAEETVSRLYGRIVEPGMAVLDLMGSWTSHLPDNMETVRLTVLGMNKEELTRNIQATDIVLHDLNDDPILPFADASFDAVLCTVSIEYLADPIAVFREAARILRQDGLLLVSFSNRWFGPKVISLWPELHDFERMGFVLELFLESGNFFDLQNFSRRGLPRPTDDRHAELPYSDPVFLVWGRKR
ncbi:MAG: methyltransferase domain-containing protein [Proteobacteria bacterium]|nr:methyltransferase domain-containing protein [Pseudomonadota bacterium]MBU4295920.1 methyltransferase domain-containing protein [Pseudomonadota bacterium]MCG2748347.1 methyltransferase domain-containing protein [Desulfobulbaceae bacterium]